MSYMPRRRKRINFFKLFILLLIFVVLLSAIGFIGYKITDVLFGLSIKKDYQHIINNITYICNDFKLEKNNQEYSFSKVTEYNQLFNRFIEENQELESISICQRDFNQKLISKYIIISDNQLLNTYITNNITNSLLKTSDFLRTGFVKRYNFNHKTNFESDLKVKDISDNYILLSDKNQDLKLDYSDENTKYFKNELNFKNLYNKEKLVVKEKNYPKDGTKKIAFTFDDGPLNENHDLIRELFDQYSIPADFFFVGSVVKNNPQRVIDAYINGHEINNHSYTHADLKTLDDRGIYEEIFSASDEIFKLIGEDPKYFRPPYGSYDDRSDVGYEIILWTVDSEDWRSRNKNIIYQKVLNDIKFSGNNIIVLFHDLYKTSFQAVEELIPVLKDEGYQFVKVSDIVEE